MFETLDKIIIVCYNVTKEDGRMIQNDEKVLQGLDRF